jgi:hypothetical protein
MTTLALLLILAVGPAFAEEPQLIDVVYLKDGTTLRGLVVEQQAGISVKLASAEGIVWTLENGEIDLIEKEPASEPLAVQYTDVVLLKDGVLFRGSVVEQRPGDSVDLETSTGSLLKIPIDDVWAFVKRKQVVGAPPSPASTVDVETESLRIRLQIELTGGSLAVREFGGFGGGGEREGGGSESALEEEIETLERERDESDHRAKDEERRTERETLQTLGREVSELLEQLLGDLKECSGQGGVGQSGSLVQRVSYQPLSVSEEAPVGGLASPFGERVNGMVDQTLAKIPTDEVIAARAQQAEDSKSLQQLLVVPGWRISRLDLDRIQQLVDRLPVDERQRLYEINQRTDGGKGALLNAIPFTFTGSWSQGDSPAGILGGSLFLASLTVDSLATFAFGNRMTLQTPWGWIELYNDPASLLFWAGPACYLATYAIGIALPPLRENAWNSALAKALRVDNSPPPKAPKPRAGPPPVALVPGSHGEPRLEVRLLSLRY